MNLNRRSFLKSGAAVGGGLLLGFHLTGCDKTPLPAADAASLQPNAFLEITPAGAVILQLHKAEMGQGVATAMPTLVAEELRVDPARIEVRYADYHPDLADPGMFMMATGGSSSVHNSYEPLRRAGATAKALLVGAAARIWEVDAANVLADDGRVRDLGSGRTLGYGELVAVAKTLPVPKEVPLTEPAQFKWIGKFDRRVDARAKTDGSAVFGLDVHQPELLTAVLVRCPHFGGSVAGFDPAKALEEPGVKAVVEAAGGVAVVAEGYWPARKAAGLLQVNWNKGPLAGLDSAAILAEQRRRLEQPGRAVSEAGEVPAGGRWIEAEYHVPYLAHAPMEPLNCIARVEADRVDVWLGNQSPEVVRAGVAAALDRPREQVFVHSYALGGGFGRRSFADVAVEAALIAQQLGRTVRLVWSREDDLRHGFYRPTALTRLRACIDDGKVTGWESRTTCPSLMNMLIGQMGAAAFPAWTPSALLDGVARFLSSRDSISMEGLAELPYRLDYQRTDFAEYDPGVPVGPWRSVGHSQNGFFVESFVDEVAHALGRDPLALRLEWLKEDQSRLRNVLQLAAERAGWGKAPAGRFLGLASHVSFDTAVAQVVEISIEDGQPRVHKVTCAVDCGLVVNPDIVVMQVESAVNFALTAALSGEITIADGAVVQSNFHDYPLLRMGQAPVIDVILAPGTDVPTGIGEPGVPPLAPALGNAIFAATGQRLRTLPFRLA